MYRKHATARPADSPAGSQFRHSCTYAAPRVTFRACDWALGPISKTSEFLKVLRVDIERADSLRPIRTIARFATFTLIASSAFAGLATQPAKADLTPYLSIDDVSVVETTGAATTVTATIRANVAAAQQMTVSYTTADGSATNPSDYTATTGSVLFPAGTLTKTITVSVAAPMSSFASTVAGVLICRTIFVN